MKKLYRKINLQFFADGDEPNLEPQPEPTPEPTPEPKKLEMTQEELDAMIAKRLERERKKFVDYDDLKTKLSEFEKQAEERRLAELSEKERAEELAKKYESEKSDLAKQLEEYKAQVQREKVTNEFIKLATSANVAYVDDAMRLVDLSAVQFDEAGNPIGVDAIVNQLVQDKPFLIKKTEPKIIGNPSNPSDHSSQKTSEQLLKEAADKARRTGRIEDQVAYAALKRELGL